jgi:hypothetical protein
MFLSMVLPSPRDARPNSGKRKRADKAAAIRILLMSLWFIFMAVPPARGHLNDIYY